MDVANKVGKQLKFDVSSKADRQRFNTTFIQEIRRELGDTSVMQDAFQLPPQTDTPSFQDLVLIAGESTATLRLRTDNLYVVGFRNQAGRWFEFRHEDGGLPPTIPEAMMLHFSGSYVGTNSLAPLNGVRIVNSIILFVLVC